MFSSPCGGRRFKRSLCATRPSRLYGNYYSIALKGFRLGSIRYKTTATPKGFCMPSSPRSRVLITRCYMCLRYHDRLLRRRALKQSQMSPSTLSKVKNQKLQQINQRAIQIGGIKWLQILVTFCNFLGRAHSTRGPKTDGLRQTRSRLYSEPADGDQGE